MSVLVVACGDDDDDRGGVGGSGGAAGAAGTGGTGGGGAGGSGGTGGTGGTGNGGTASTAGSGGAAGTGGTGSDPDAGDAGGDTGFLEVRVTVTDELQLPGFNIDLGSGFDFSEGTITFRIRAEAFGDTVGVAPFVNDANGFTFQGGSFTALNSTNGFGTDTFVPVSFDLSGLPAEADAGSADFDKSDVRVVGIQIGTGAGFVGLDADAGADAGGEDIVVFIDSITFTDVDGVNNFEFTTGAEGFVLNPAFGFTDAVVIPH